MHSRIKRNVLQHKINTKKLKLGLVAFYDIRPGNFEHMKDDLKHKDTDDLGHGVINVTIRQSMYDFLSAFNQENHVHILCHFQDVAHYLPKITNFSMHMHLAPPLRVTLQWNITKMFGTIN